MSADDRQSQRGQVLVLLALAMTALVLGAAVVVDGGFALAQRRAVQNAADFAAMAGTRIVGQARTGRTTGPGAGSIVEDAVTSTLMANDAQLVSAQYVDESGNALGYVVDAGSIPKGAFGVVVNATTDWQPFLLGVIGVTDWAAGATATAKTPGWSLGGGVMPVGIRDTQFNSLEQCPLTSLDDCISQNLTSGKLNIPGGFGWLKFGLQGNGGKCDWASSLGMVADGGCESSKTFLDSQIGPPANSHGCCTGVGVDGEDKIGSLTGNEWGDLSYYFDNQIPVWVPVYDLDFSAPQGANAYYKIVGFGAIVFTGDNEHAKWLEGAAIENACLPGTEVADSNYCTAPGGAFTVAATGAVQLVR